MSSTTETNPEGFTKVFGLIETLIDRQDDTNRKIADVHERVIRIEAQEYKQEIGLLRAEITALTTRLGSLETQRAMLAGASTFATQLREWAPFIVALVGLAVFYFKRV